MHFTGRHSAYFVSYDARHNTRPLHILEIPYDAWACELMMSIVELANEELQRVLRETTAKGKRQ